MLELDLSALAFMMKCFPEIKEVEDMRKSIGRYGLTGKQQVGIKVDKLSEQNIYLICELSCQLHGSRIQIIGP